MNWDSILNNQVVIVILLLIFVGSIALVAFVLQNKVPFFKQPEEPVDPETAVREEVERVIVKLDRPTFETETPTKQSKKTVTKKKPVRKKKNVKSKS